MDLKTKNGGTLLLGGKIQYISWNEILMSFFVIDPSQGAWFMFCVAHDELSCQLAGLRILGLSVPFVYIHVWLSKPTVHEILLRKELFVWHSCNN
jgi:hypothetical protein